MRFTLSISHSNDTKKYEMYLRYSQSKMEILNLTTTEKTVAFMNLAVAISENSV
nr:MAG TPA: hypothetical protein [Caudoviricetes sp.]